MRPKIVIAVLLAGIAGLVAIMFLKQLGNRPQPTTAPITQPAASAPETIPSRLQVSPPAVKSSSAALIQTTSPTATITNEVTGEDPEHIEEQISRLETLEANDDDASLQAILKELTNTNPIIRHVAIEATIQFGGHTSVPVLQDLAARTTNPDEKKELLDAAEFLALPTLSEVRAENPDVKIVSPQNPPTVPNQP